LKTIVREARRELLLLVRRYFLLGDGRYPPQSEQESLSSETPLFTVGKVGSAVKGGHGVAH
jgi:hypothetical protein